MSILTIQRALPNPPGKDRTPSNQLTNEKLNEEWFEVENTSENDIQRFDVQHQGYNYLCEKKDRLTAVMFVGVIRPGEVIRFHSGSGENYSDDQTTHYFLNKNAYILNNQCGDTISLHGPQGLIDIASYAAKPPEGKILVRVDNGFLA